MSNVLIAYWSGTGNTEAMANAVADGVREAGGEPLVTPVSNADATLSGYTHIAFGCPSMGDEVLEECEMEPFFAQAESQLQGKNVALFGSYDWGDGQWMRDWAARAQAAGAILCGSEGLTAHLEPDDAALAACRALGAALAKM